jgi:hypothetical protein
MNKIRKIKNIILAMSVAAAAIPVNPRIPATMAITRKMSTHESIVISLNERHLILVNTCRDGECNK